jgi:hypothetical protein
MIAAVGCGVLLSQPKDNTTQHHSHQTTTACLNQASHNHKYDMSSCTAEGCRKRGGMFHACHCLSAAQLATHPAPAHPPTPFSTQHPPTKYSAALTIQHSRNKTLLQSMYGSEVIFAVSLAHHLAGSGQQAQPTIHVVTTNPQCWASLP